MAANSAVAGLGRTILLMIICAGGMTKTDDKTATSTNYVADPVSSCRKRLQLSKDLMLLDNIVGVGWDDLRAVQMASVMHMTYDKCQTTPDRLYLVPDHVMVLSVQRIHADVVSDYYKDHKQFAESKSHSVGAEADFDKKTKVPISVSGSLNYEWQDIKKKSVQESTSIIRTQVQYHAYTLILKPDAPFTDAFQKRLTAISDYQQKKETPAVEYLAQLLVRDYGTHVVRQADVGVELNQFDYVDMKEMEESHETINGLRVSASIRFNDTFSFGGSGGFENTNNVTNGYTKSLHQSEIRSRGGFDVDKLMQLADTGETAGNFTMEYFSIDDVVPLSRSAQLLSEAITARSSRMNNTSEAARIGSAVKTAIITYFDNNTKYGCMEPNAAGYDFNANAQNDSQCQWTDHNYTFYGVYQTWVEVGGDDDSSYPLHVVNEMTGEAKCTDGADDIAVATILADTRSFIATTHLHWCRAKGVVPRQSGFMFGGLYSRDQENPLTGAASCPGQFSEVKLAGGITLCISRNYEIDHKFAIDFGGFVSCETKEKNCPTGYVNYFLHRYSITSRWPNRPETDKTDARGCDLYYCIKQTDIPQYTPSNANRPPYIDPPWIKAAEPTVMTW